MKADNKYILFVLPADLKGDLDGIKANLQVNDLTLATKDEIKSKIGLEAGSIPPFGSIIGLKTYVDIRLAENDEIAFNAGRHDRSIKMKYSDFIKTEKPTELDLHK